jgi:hypothetical protein
LPNDTTRILYRSTGKSLVGWRRTGIERPSCFGDRTLPSPFERSNCPVDQEKCFCGVWERDRILSGVARAAVGGSLGADGAQQSFEAQIRHAVGVEIRRDLVDGGRRCNQLGPPWRLDTVKTGRDRRRAADLVSRRLMKFSGGSGDMLRERCPLTPRGASLPYWRQTRVICQIEQVSLHYPSC